jgi:hypothetical protein
VGPQSLLFFSWESPFRMALSIIAQNNLASHQAMGQLYSGCDFFSLFSVPKKRCVGRCIQARLASVEISIWTPFCLHRPIAVPPSLLVFDLDSAMQKPALGGIRPNNRRKGVGSSTAGEAPFCCCIACLLGMCTVLAGVVLCRRPALGSNIRTRRWRRPGVWRASPGTSALLPCRARNGC